MIRLGGAVALPVFRWSLGMHPCDGRSGSKFPMVIDLDYTIQPLRDLTSREIGFVNPPESVAARGAGVVADSIAGEKSFDVRVCNLGFESFDIEAGFRFVNAGGTLFFLDLETGAGHFWNRVSGQRRMDQKPAASAFTGLVALSLV